MADKVPEPQMITIVINRHHEFITRQAIKLGRDVPPFENVKMPILDIPEHLRWLMVHQGKYESIFERIPYDTTYHPNPNVPYDRDQYRGDAYLFRDILEITPTDAIAAIVDALKELEELRERVANKMREDNARYNKLLEARRQQKKLQEEFQQKLEAQEQLRREEERRRPRLLWRWFHRRKGELP